MSGHSHWATIKHKKAKEDKRRGKVFSRVAKQIMSAARRAGKDPDLNLELKYAIEEARAANMPKDTVERAILKGVGELEGTKLEGVRYEGYGAGGAAVMVDVLTDNRNRTTSEVRKILSSHGGELGASGCVAWSFETKGLVLLPLNDRSEDELFDIAIEAGADDFQREGDLYELSCDVRQLQRVKVALSAANVKWESAQVTMVPKSYVDLSRDDGLKALKLMEELEDNEDVTNVHSNFSLPPELVAELEAE